MNVINFGQFVTRTSQRMTNFLYTTVTSRVVGPTPVGLPAGAIYVPDEKVIFAATACTKGIFDEAMWAAAALTGADIVVGHVGRYPVPNILDDVTFTALIHIQNKPHMLGDMVLFWQSSEGYWLLPSQPGPFVALTPEGLRVSFRPPFVDLHERAAGVGAAAAKIIRATRTGEAF